MSKRGHSRKCPGDSKENHKLYFLRGLGYCSAAVGKPLDNIGHFHSRGKGQGRDLITLADLSFVE